MKTENILTPQSEDSQAIAKHDVLNKYKLPEQVLFCKKCTMSNQRPRISFDEHGVCSACKFAEHKQKHTDWEEREKELIELCDRHRKGNGQYDVLVPVSGGKDGGLVAHMLKYKYGMNPLTVTWSPLVPSEIGRKNLDAFVMSGFDNILGRPNGRATRLMTKLAFQHMGDPFQPFIYGQQNFPLKMAIENNISLMMYGENGEAEYGGDMKNAYRPTRELSDHDGHFFSGLPPEFWLDHGLSEVDLHPFKVPRFEDIMANNTEIHYFSYYHFWDPQENFYYCTENTGFTPNPERSEGTYSKYASLDDKIDGFHYYLAYIKFGIGRATSDTAHEIRDGKITREEGVALVEKYDGEFPSKYYELFLEYADITEQEFHDVIDSWRSDHLWAKENGKWKLKHSVY